MDPPASLLDPNFKGNIKYFRKNELQRLAEALELSMEGTNPELKSRLEDHLNQNEGVLIRDPQFSGLFARGKTTGVKGSTKRKLTEHKDAEDAASAAKDGDVEPTR